MEDETPLAALVARRYATAQHDDRAALDYFAAARQQARVFGEPFGDSSSVPTLSVCALARRHVTVAISPATAATRCSRAIGATAGTC